MAFGFTLREGAIGGRLITTTQWAAFGAGGFAPRRSFTVAAAGACTLNVDLEDGSNVSIAIPASGGQATWGGLTAIIRHIHGTGTTLPATGLQIAYHIAGERGTESAQAHVPN